MLGMYQPDGIAAFTEKGQTFLVTANEGDVREYDGLTPPATKRSSRGHRARSGRVSRRRDAPEPRRWHRTLNVTSFNGDTDGDGDFDRAVSVRRAFVLDLDRAGRAGVRQRRRPRADHGCRASRKFQREQHEQHARQPQRRQGSRAGGRHHRQAVRPRLRFIVLERIGGVMVYDVTDPTAPPFVQYINTRKFGVRPRQPPPGISVRKGARHRAKTSPTGKPLLSCRTRSAARCECSAESGRTSDLDRERR